MYQIEKKIIIIFLQLIEHFLSREEWRVTQNFIGISITY